ncbi:hypothetical protein LPN04_02840 [Rugamonas sp. A1-17]|nr:hypothetical protein [Rugamonas sp. A1-17]
MESSRFPIHILSVLFYENLQYALYLKAVFKIRFRQTHQNTAVKRYQEVEKPASSLGEAGFFVVGRLTNQHEMPISGGHFVGTDLSRGGNTGVNYGTGMHFYSVRHA